MSTGSQSPTNASASQPSSDPADSGSGYSSMLTPSTPKRWSIPPAVRAWELQLMVYRRVWKSNVAGSVIRPLIYLAGMGLGVGGLVDSGGRSEEVFGDLSYFQFFGPGLIATTAMMVLVNDSLWPIMGGFKWQKTYFSQASTPLGPSDVSGGMALWQITKSLIVSVGVAVALALFPSIRSWGLVWAALAGALCGVAHSAPAMAWSASRENEWSFPNIGRFVVVPMFLFAGAFYPITQLPDWLQWFARVTPIYHGVELCRGFTFGGLSAVEVLGHVVYLLIFVVVGWYLSARIFAKRLGV